MRKRAPHDRATLDRATLHIANTGELIPAKDGYVVVFEELETLMNALRQEMQRDQDRLFRQVFFGDAAQ